MARKSLEDKVVFITGASSGIGSAIALECARRGADIVLAARRVDRLDEVASQVRSFGRRALPVACDVTVDGDLERAVSEGLASLGSIDRVYANAGFGVAGTLEKLDLEDYRRQFETNVFGVLRTARASLDALEASGGSLAVMGSVMSHVSLPGTSPYAMSKFAVGALAAALRNEWRPRGVSVTLLAPGFIDSEIRQVDNEGHRDPEKSDSIPRWLRMRTDTAARKMVSAVVRRRREAVITFHGKLGVFLARHTPGLLDLLIRVFGVKGRRA